MLRVGGLSQGECSAGGWRSQLPLEAGQLPGLRLGPFFPAEVALDELLRNQNEPLRLSLTLSVLLGPT